MLRLEFSGSAAAIGPATSSKARAWKREMMRVMALFLPMGQSSLFSCSCASAGMSDPSMDVVHRLIHEAIGVEVGRAHLRLVARRAPLAFHALVELGAHVDLGHQLHLPGRERVVVLREGRQ